MIFIVGGVQAYIIEGTVMRSDAPAVTARTMDVRSSGRMIMDSIKTVDNTPQGIIAPSYLFEKLHSPNICMVIADGPFYHPFTDAATARCLNIADEFVTIIENGCVLTDRHPETRA